MDEMIHMGPSQSTLSFNNKEMNIAAGLCVRCARKMRNSGPRPARVTGTQMGFQLQEATRKVRTPRGNGVGVMRMDGKVGG